jgi:hypothetical protein
VIARTRDLLTGWCYRLVCLALSPVRTRLRFLVTAWTFVFVVLGNAAHAMAADGFITAPDLGQAGGQTLFEKYDASAYTYPVDTDSDHDGLDSPGFNMTNMVTNGITWLALSLLRGALVALQWLLNLTIYRDQAGAIDSAVSELGQSVFLPLLVLTLGIGASTIYMKSRRDGGGIINDLSWMVAATLFSLVFITQPSVVLGTIDGARVAVSNSMMTTYAKVAGTTESSTGYPTPTTGTDTPGSTRQLTDSLWNVYGVNGWCYVAWESVESCKVVAQSYLDDPAGEDGGTPWGKAREALREDGEVDPFAEDTGWVRGQEGGRLGAALLLGFVAGGAAALIITLVVFGLLAVIGVLILALIAVLFLAAWVIPGRPRAIGVRWLESLIGTFIQSVIITSIIGAVMIVGSMFNASIGTYGIFMTALFNLVALILGLRYREQFEHLVGFGTAATGRSAVSGYMAARMVSGLAGTGARMAGGIVKGSAVGGTRLAAAGTIPLAYAGGKAAHGAKAAGGHMRAGYQAAKTAPLRSVLPTILRGPASAPAAAPAAGAARTPTAPAHTQPTARPFGTDRPEPAPATPAPPVAPRPAAPKPTMPAPAAPAPAVASPAPAKPAARPMPSGTTPPPPPAPAAPRLASPSPAARAPRPAAAPTPQPVQAGSSPRMTAPARRYRVQPVPPRTGGES